MSQPAIPLDGIRLTCEQVRTIAREGAPVSIPAAARRRARAAWKTVREVADRQPVYGRTTGVGANRGVEVSDADDEHGLRLLRSHAGGAGPLLDPARVRAMLAVRLNQLAAGGAGVDPGLLAALAEALNRGLTPPVRTYGAIGTADLTALASTALCLIGERPWLGGTMPAYPLASADALAFISSSAATLGEAALACQDLRVLLRASLVIAALSFVAVDGSPEPFATVVHDTRPHAGQRTVAAQMRELLGDEPRTGARIQDPYSYRALPQVHGAAVDAAVHLERVLTIEMNAAGENPLVDVVGKGVLHNGNFHTAYVALALDAARAALVQTAALSAARLGTLVEPAYTGLRPFLADGPDPSSGIMILEYVTQSALADLRQHAVAAAIGNAVISRGVEEHASFSAQAARSATHAVGTYQVVLACGLVGAVRALRLRGVVPPEPLRPAYERATAVLDPRTADRPLDDDLEAAIGVLRAL